MFWVQFLHEKWRCFSRWSLLRLMAGRWPDWPATQPPFPWRLLGAHQSPCPWSRLGCLSDLEKLKQHQERFSKYPVYIYVYIFVCIYISIFAKNMQTECAHTSFASIHAYQQWWEDSMWIHSGHHMIHLRTGLARTLNCSLWYHQ